LGGTIRFTAHDGGEGESVRGFFGSYNPREKFYDSAFLFSYSLVDQESMRLIISAGPGIFSGKRLSDDRTDLIEFEKVAGLALEFGMTSAGSLFGISLLLIGNMNAESSVYGIVASISLGN